VYFSLRAQITSLEGINEVVCSRHKVKDHIRILRSAVSLSAITKGNMC